MELLEKLQKEYREKMKRIEEIRDIELGKLTRADRTERDKLLDRIEVLTKEIDAENRAIQRDLDECDDADSLFFDGGDTNHSQARKNDDLIFQAADGREHRAISISKRFTGSEYEKGLEEIGPGSLGKILRAKLLGDPMGLNDSERRAMGEGIGGAGGWFVNPLVSGYVIDLARNASCCMKAGAWTLPMDSPEVTLVKVLDRSHSLLACRA